MNRRSTSGLTVVMLSMLVALSLTLFPALILAGGNEELPDTLVVMTLVGLTSGLIVGVAILLIRAVQSTKRRA